MCGYCEASTDIAQKNFFAKEERSSWYRRFRIEQRKLEAMVKEFIKDGNGNLGQDKKILRQSGILDRLVLEKMLHSTK